MQIRDILIASQGPEPLIHQATLYICQISLQLNKIKLKITKQ